MSGRVDFRTGKIVSNKRSILQEDIATLNIYAPNYRDPKYMKQNQTEFKGQMDNTVILGDINISLYIISGASSTICKDIENLNTTNQLDLIDVYRTLYPIAVEKATERSSMGN